MRINRTIIHILIFISAITIIASCEDNIDYNLNEKYVNSSEVDSIYDLRNNENQLVEHRVILYKDTSFVIISFNKSGEMNDSTYSDRNGKYQGKRRIIFEDGSSKLLSYTDGKLNGKAFLFDEKNRLLKVGNYTHDNANGEWIEYFKSGLPKKYEFMPPQGGITFQRTWNEDGTIKEDKGHPIVFKRVTNAKSSNAVTIYLTPPPFSHIRIFEFNPIDSSIIRELTTENKIIEYKKSNHSEINDQVYLKWALYDSNTDTLQQEDFGKIDGDLNK